MQRATRDVLYFETGPDNPVTLRVRPGEEFEVETQLNRGPWIDRLANPDAERQRLRAGNPASGCVYVEGAKPGMVLSIQLGAIELDPLGFTNFRGQNGAMPAWFGSSGVGAHHRIVEIKDNEIL